jgi:predicted nucleic acid-binding protein
MSDRIFLDTNIFIYAWDASHLGKQVVALELIRSATEDKIGVISYQVVQEFLNAALTKARRKMTYDDARVYLEKVLRPLLSVPSSIPLFDATIHLQGRYQFSWYDSLIVSAAQQANCKILYTEDLQHGQRLGDLLIQNPFL